ncbi:MAG: hypothetical protein CBC71_09880 [Rhodobacteraceae bacterium TMED111]|nr:hypothetical protein [Marinovum sp.]OUV39198.1 MAG: hypothetical protein CBC71_09880 [Rhodobacteraceae bacterium TMED111]|tara:strand:- start:992 stop:1501 length:510 start_codon:yes stop_codon:yes gene_type:complete
MNSYFFIKHFVFWVFFIVLISENVSASSFKDESCSPHTQLIIENKSEGKDRLIIEAVVADEPGERAVGLMNRTELSKNAGMLFVYDKPSAPKFWMKNTLIPLDIIFLDKSGKIIKIFEQVPRLSENKITAGNNVSFVLEINAGLIEQFEVDPKWKLDLTDFFEASKPFC